MIETEQIYYYSRKAQAESKNRGFKMPKDFDKHLNNRMSVANRDALNLATKWFNTKWRNIEPYGFFQCGFELWKNFTYTKIFDVKVLNLYKAKDKNKKRELGDAKEGLIKSVKFVKTYIRGHATNKSVALYLHSSNSGVSLLIEHYLHNKVDKFFVVWLIRMGMFRMTDEDIAVAPYISEKFREMYFILNDMKDFLAKLKECLND